MGSVYGTAVNPNGGSLKRISVLMSIIASVVFASVVSATPGPRLDTQDISSRQCKGNGAKQLVNVHYTLLNDYDSGFAGNAWANDTINRRVRIWRHGDGTFCVQVADEGEFVTFAAPSPSGSSTVSAGVEGEMKGGYITTNIPGTYTPTRPTRGDLGDFDMMCDASFNCPGARPSWKDYFTSPAGNEFAEWGWIYRADEHGTWLNQDNVLPVNSGDITG